MTDEQKKDQNTDQQKENNETVAEAVQNNPAPANTTAETKAPQSGTEAQQDKKEATTERQPRQRRDFKRGGGKGGNRRRRGGPRRERPEFDQKIVSLRRVTRVMAGGRRFSFSAAIVIGDKKGRVGFGIGKANDTSAAIEKAVRDARKNMITLKLTETNSIPHDSHAKYKASEIMLRPVTGKGLAAGGAVRTVLELAGVNEVGGKILSRSKNNINNSRATIDALRPFAVVTSKKAPSTKPAKQSS